MSYKWHSKNLMGKTGGEYIEQFLKDYEIEFVNKNGNCTTTEMDEDIKKFTELLKGFSSNWVNKKAFNSMKSRLNNIEQELNEERENNYEKYWQDKFNNFQKNLENALSTGSSLYKSKVDNEKKELENKIDELEKRVKKWQAMYTGQAEANAILCKKLEEKS